MLIEKTKKVKKKASPMWGKKTLDGDDKLNEKLNGNGEKQGDLGGWLTDENGNGNKLSGQKDADNEGKTNYFCITY